MIRAADRLVARFAAAERAALAAGAAALALAALGGAFFGAGRFFQAYLIAFLFVTGLAVGCLGVAMTHQLTGGQWGVPVERFAEAGARTLPWLALAFVPIAIWLGVLYPWSRAAVVAADDKLQHKALYLNTPFFLARAFVYFAVWSVLAWLLDRWSRAQDRTGAPAATHRLKRLSAGGAVAYGFTVTFAAIDWIMSLEPRWYSTVYGGMIGVQWMLAAFTFVILLVNLVAGREPFADVLSTKVRVDLGNLLLTFTVLWTYLAFVQLLIIWAGDEPEEVVWYVHRLHGGWQGLAVFLAVVQFLLPLFALLMRALKRRARFMVVLTALLLFAHWIDEVWLVLPAFHPDGFTIGWLDFITTVGLAGLWTGAFLHLLTRRPLLPLHDPALPVAEAEYA